MKLVFQISAGIVVAGIIFSLMGAACVALFVGGASKAVDDALSSIDKTQCAERPTEIARRHNSQTAEAYALATQRAFTEARDSALPASSHTIIASGEQTTVAADDLVSASREAMYASDDATVSARC